MLAVDKINTFHDKVQALFDLSLVVAAEELVAVVGPNGAGKSTLLGTIAGLYAPRSGTIRLDGKSIAGLPAEEIVRRGLSLVPERRQIFADLTVRENLILGAYHHYRRTGAGLHGDLAGVYELFPPLQALEPRRAGTLSGGEQQMLAIGRGVMARPKVLLLDEPSLGLAPMLVRDIFAALTRLRRQGTTILLVEQHIHAVAEFSDRICVLERGHLVVDGPPEEVLQDPRVEAAYIGRRGR